MRSKLSLMLVFLLLASSATVFASENVVSMPRPEFASTTTPDDGGAVKPVDIRSEEPIKIAVIGLENNRFGSRSKVP